MNMKFKFNWKKDQQRKLIFLLKNSQIHMKKPNKQYKRQKRNTKRS